MRLEKLTADAEGVHTRLVAAPRQASSPRAAAPEVIYAEAPRAEARPEPSRIEASRPAPPPGREPREPAFARFAERYSAAKGEPAPAALAEAVARNDLILEDDEAPRAARAPRPRANGPAFARRRGADGAVAGAGPSAAGRPEAGHPPR
ncbi:MAG: hypothetical protein WDM85_03235 [Caulobacteraceae bacterium]